MSVKETIEDKDDPNLFVFSFESHGRCATPQRFPVKKERQSAVFLRFRKGWSGQFFFCGVDDSSGFTLGDERSDACCQAMSRGFEGLENTTLTGKKAPWERAHNHHNCARFVAVQLE